MVDFGGQTITHSLGKIMVRERTVKSFSCTINMLQGRQNRETTIGTALENTLVGIAEKGTSDSQTEADVCV